MESIKNINNLLLFWDAPSVQSHYKSLPNYIVSHLIGHEGKGTLYALLKEKSLANGIISGNYIDLTGIYIFHIKIKLTAKGMEQIETVLELVFQYLKILRDMTVEEWEDCANEISLIDKANFMYKSKEYPSKYVMELSKKLRIYDTKDILTGSVMLKEFDLKKTQSFLNCLSVERLIYIVQSKATGERDLDQTEEYFGTKYRVDNIDENLLKRLENTKPNPKLKLPSRNKFISSDFTVFDHKEKSKFPQLIVNEEFLECFYIPGQSFKKPFGAIKLCIFIPSIYQSPRNSLMTDILLRYIFLVLEEVTYDAGISGIETSLNHSKASMYVQINGFSEMLPKLFESVLESFNTHKIDEDLLKVATEKTKNQLISFNVAAAHTRANYNLGWALSGTHWHIDTKLKLLNTIDKESIEYFYETLFRNSFSKILVVGNVLKETAFSICNKYTEFVTNSPKNRPINSVEFENGRQIKMELGLSSMLLEPTRNKKDPNSCTVVSYQIGSYTDQLYCLCSLLQQCVKEMLFIELRTKKNLGYYVTSFLDDTNEVISFNILVQGENHPNYVLKIIDETLEKIFKEIEEFSEKRFEKHRMALQKKFEMKFETLDAVVSYHWNEITKGRYFFDKKQKRAELTKKITLKSLLEFFKSFILNPSEKRTRFISAVVSPMAKKADFKYEEAEMVEDVWKFKAKSSLFPCDTSLRKKEVQN